MASHLASRSPQTSASADPKNLPSYFKSSNSFPKAVSELPAFLPRKRSRSDTWVPSPTGFRHEGDAHIFTSTHCWQCGAAFHPQMVFSQEKAPSLSPTSRLPLLPQVESVEAPPVSHNSHPGTPRKSNPISSLSQTDKLMRMKDAMLDATDIPVIALWHDESTAAQNRALGRIMYFDTDPVSDEADDILSRYRLFTEDFERELDQSEFPIIRLCRTQQPFSRIRIGIMDSQSRRTVHEVSGQCVYDEKTGGFQAAVCVLKDVTWYTELLKVQSEQNERNEQQFQLICETLPQIVRYSS